MAKKREQKSSGKKKEKEEKVGSRRGIKNFTVQCKIDSLSKV